MPTLSRSFLLLDRLAYVLNRFANLATSFPVGVLRLAGHFVGDAFVVKRLIIGEIAGGLFDFAFQRFGLSFEFILVHHGLPPQTMVRRPESRPTRNSTIAITSSTCTNAPIVYVPTTPRSHAISRMTA